MLCSWTVYFLFYSRTVSLSSSTSKTEAQFRSETCPHAGSSCYFVKPSLAATILWSHLCQRPFCKAISASGHFVKPSLPQPFNNVPVVSGFTVPRYSSLSWARWIQSTSFHLISFRSLLIPFSYLRLVLPSYLFLLVIYTKTLYALLLSPLLSTCPTHLIHTTKPFIM